MMFLPFSVNSVQIWMKLYLVVSAVTLSVLFRLRSGDERPAVTDSLRDGERGGRLLVFCLLHGPDGELSSC